MKRLVLYLCALMACLCAVAQGNYSITGKDYHGTTRVYLQEVGIEGRLDSAEVKDAQFTFKGHTDRSKFVEIMTKEGELMGQFILEPGTISLRGNNYYGSGAPLNEAFCKLSDELAVYDKQLRDGEITEQERDKICSDKVVALVNAHLNDALSARAFYFFNSYIEKYTFKDVYDRGNEGLKAVPWLKTRRAQYELTAKTEPGMMFEKKTPIMLSRKSSQKER